MSRPDPFQCNSISQFLDEVDAKVSKWEGSVWYRGVDRHVSLLPKIFREERVHHGSQGLFRDLEEQRLVDAIDRRSSFLARGLPTQDVLSLAQHFRFPTRLLDWSEHLGTAVYFAISHRQADPHVWLLNPVILNALHLFLADADVGDRPIGDVAHEELQDYSRKYTQRGVNTPISVFDAKSAQVESYRKLAQGHPLLNEENGDASQEQCFSVPIAFYPQTLGLRLSLQDACFTIHGTKKICISDLRRELHPTVSENLVTCFSFDDEFRKTKLKYLRRLCPTPMQIYGDQEGMQTGIIDQMLWD